MRKSIPRWLRVATLGVTVALIVGGLAVLGISTLTAEEDEIPPEIREQLGLPFPLRLVTPVPLPDTSSAVEPDEARALLARVPGVAEVIAAVERADIDALMALAEQKTMTCSELYGRDVYEICPDYPRSNPSFETVRFETGIDNTRRPLEDVRGWVADLTTPGPLTLDIVTRDARQPTGRGGLYYVTFVLPSPGLIGGGTETLGLGLLVRAGSPTPIERFGFLSPTSGALVWLQEFEPEHQVLITPASLEGRPTQSDHILLPPGYPGYPEGYPPPAKSK